MAFEAAWKIRIENANSVKGGEDFSKISPVNNSSPNLQRLDATRFYQTTLDPSEIAPHSPEALHTHLCEDGLSANSSPGENFVEDG